MEPTRASRTTLLVILKTIWPGAPIFRARAMSQAETRAEAASPATGTRPASTSAPKRTPMKGMRHCESRSVANRSISASSAA
jgi:hypothetical protein